MDLAEGRAANAFNRIPWADTIVYETHVKGFTKLHPAIPEELRERSRVRPQGSRRLCEKPGITSIELLPVHAFPDDSHLTEKGLHNYWGYNTIGFFSPASRYYGPKA